jgi:hypothetical protein
MQNNVLFTLLFLHLLQVRVAAVSEVCHSLEVASHFEVVADKSIMKK